MVSGNTKSCGCLAKEIKQSKRISKNHSDITAIILGYKRHAERRGFKWLLSRTFVEKLIKNGRMQPPGLNAFQEYDPKDTGQYSYERPNRKLDAAYEVQFKKNQKAWDFFQSQPPSYRKTASWWVMSAQREDTRQRRLATLINDSENGERIAAVTLNPKS